MYSVQFGPTDILICLADVGWENSLYFSLRTQQIKDAAQGDPWEINIVEPEELEKLRIELQEISTPGIWAVE